MFASHEIIRTQKIFPEPIKDGKEKEKSLPTRLSLLVVGAGIVNFKNCAPNDDRAY